MYNTGFTTYCVTIQTRHDWFIHDSFCVTARCSGLEAARPVRNQTNACKTLSIDTIGSPTKLSKRKRTPCQNCFVSYLYRYVEYHFRFQRFTVPSNSKHQNGKLSLSCTSVTGCLWVLAAWIAVTVSYLLRYLLCIILYSCVSLREMILPSIKSTHFLLWLPTSMPTPGCIIGRPFSNCLHNKLKYYQTPSSIPSPPNWCQDKNFLWYLFISLLYSTHLVLCTMVLVHGDTNFMRCWMFRSSHFTMIIIFIIFQASS